MKALRSGSVASLAAILLLASCAVPAQHAVVATLLLHLPEWAREKVREWIRRRTGES